MPYLLSAGCSVSHSYHHGFKHWNISHQYYCCSNAGGRERWVWKVHLCEYMFIFTQDLKKREREKKKKVSKILFIPGHFLEPQSTTVLTGCLCWCFSLWKQRVGCWGACHGPWWTHYSSVLEKKLLNFLKSSLSRSLKLLSRYCVSIYPCYSLRWEQTT